MDPETVAQGFPEDSGYFQLQLVLKVLAPFDQLLFLGEIKNVGALVNRIWFWGLLIINIA